MRREGHPGSKPVARSQALSGSLRGEGSSVASAVGLQRAGRKTQLGLPGVQPPLLPAVEEENPEVGRKSPNSRGSHFSCLDWLFFKGGARGFSS